MPLCRVRFAFGLQVVEHRRLLHLHQVTRMWRHTQSIDVVSVSTSDGRERGCRHTEEGRCHRTNKASPSDRIQLCEMLNILLFFLSRLVSNGTEKKSRESNGNVIHCLELNIFGECCFGFLFLSLRRFNRYIFMFSFRCSHCRRRLLSLVRSSQENSLNALIRCVFSGRARAHARVFLVLLCFNYSNNLNYSISIGTKRWKHRPTQ